MLHPLVHPRRHVQFIMPILHCPASCHHACRSACCLIAGPRGELPLLGSGLSVLRYGLIGTMERLIAAHGPLVKVRMLSRQLVIVADPDAARCGQGRRAQQTLAMSGTRNLHAKACTAKNCVRKGHTKVAALDFCMTALPPCCALHTHTGAAGATHTRSGCTSLYTPQTAHMCAGHNAAVS